MFKTKMACQMFIVKVTKKFFSELNLHTSSKTNTNLDSITNLNLKKTIRKQRR